MNTPDWLTGLAIAIVFAFVVSIHRRREAIRHKFRVLIGHFVIPLGAYFAAADYLAQAGRPTLESIAIGLAVAGFFVVLADRTIPRRRSRHVPRIERRKAIARFERGTGERYDPRLYDIDHVVPFSRGGSNTADNLRVVSRSKNRSKGARSPWWDLLGGRSRR